MAKKPIRFFWEDDPWDDLSRIHEDIHRFMRDMWSVPDISVGFGSTFPVDIAEKKDKIVVTADLPGVDKENVSVRIVDNKLIIDAEQSEEEKEVDKNYLRQERRYGKFHREILLPIEVEEDEAKAEMKNGVLKIEIPKKEKSKRRGKEIKIN
ncbi:MAG: Hsp20/alpha crystallin family protein [Candidatus Aenigmarchaeota archaeon]|nr:Hsp20/alpha crystallin family protein [Candidatus Aenigmarchaeota archaeon]